MLASSNRLTSLVEGTASTHQYQFDANGNLTHQNTKKHHIWEHADRMIGCRVQTNDTSPPSIQARYLFGADDMHVKKWVRNQQEQLNTTSYIDGLMEQHHFKTAKEEKTNSRHNTFSKIYF